MIGAAIAGGGKLAALFITLSCTPVTIDGHAADKCEEEITESWVDPQPHELTACTGLANYQRELGKRAWCELVPADSLGIQPSADRAPVATPVTLRF